jgi:hypothetical protein
MSPPPLPPAIQTTILSHLLPPNIPLPQQLLSKSLLQRHLYLPPSPDDVDAFLNPVPVPGISDLLERLAGIGWRVSRVDYAHDGEHYIARVKVVEEGRGEGEGQEVDVGFEFEGQEGEKEEGRGWTYHSVHNGSTSPLSSLNWTTNQSNVSVRSEGEEQMEDDHMDENGDGAPAGYWAGFSPPTSPRLGDDGNQLPQGEDDYWASYGKSFTPGGVTPAQQTPNLSRRPTRDQVPTITSISKSDSDTNTNQQDGLLRSRIEMKIASLLRKLWISHLPASDPEFRALTYLSLARAIQSPSTSSIQAGGDESGTREKMAVLYEVYEVIEDGQDGFMRLVEKSLSAPGGGFGVESRQDSSAQLNYWE